MTMTCLRRRHRLQSILIYHRKVFRALFLHRMNTEILRRIHLRGIEISSYQRSFFYRLVRRAHRAVEDITYSCHVRSRRCEMRSSNHDLVFVVNKPFLLMLLPSLILAFPSSIPTKSPDNLVVDLLRWE